MYTLWHSIALSGCFMVLKVLYRSSIGTYFVKQKSEKVEHILEGEVSKLCGTVVPLSLKTTNGCA